MTETVWLAIVAALVTISTSLITLLLARVRGAVKEVHDITNSRLTEALAAVKALEENNRTLVARLVHTEPSQQQGS